MENLPVHISFVFMLTVLLAGWLFAKATRYNRSFEIIFISWLVGQGVLGALGFYTGINPVPPRFPWLLVPPALAITVLFITTKGRTFVDTLNIRTLTLFHVIRVPVEFVLYWLFLQKTVPEMMTFEGRNFDIFSGLSAPVVYYIAFASSRVNRSWLLIWNFVCLALVINIAVIGLLSAQTPFQQFAFEQPNIAIQYFPFNLLPSCLVPLVILAHLATIRQLIASKKTLLIAQ